MCTHICKYKYRCSLSLAYLWIANFVSASYSYQHHCFCTTLIFIEYYNLRANKCSTYKHHKHRTCVEMINCHPHVPCLHSTRVRLLTFYILIIFFNEDFFTRPGCTCLHIEQHLIGTIVGYNAIITD